MPQVDLFVLAAEPSADLHGAALIQKLQQTHPQLNIAAVSGPRMRSLPIQTIFPMEHLQVMGFLDVLAALPKIVRHFYFLRNKILELNPKAVVCIDYPGFNLRLERSLRKKGYFGKLIHYICPTVWAWGKNRIPLMAQNLDLLLTLFPFEKTCFQKTSLPVQYVGHPLTAKISKTSSRRESLLGIFPGSRKTEIERNFPLQLKIARRLVSLDPTLKIGVSLAQSDLALSTEFEVFPPEKTYELMSRCRLALATSGTATLELALHETPTVVNYAIRPLDVFIAQKIFSINLPYYCIVNIIANETIFPELFGPNLTEQNFYLEAKKLLLDPIAQSRCLSGCKKIRTLLGETHASQEAAKAILELVF